MTWNGSTCPRADRDWGRVGGTTGIFPYRGAMARRGLLDRLLDVLVPARRPPAGVAGSRDWGGAAGAAGGSHYPGDFAGVPDMEYSPAPDGRPDPGEIVWTWVPFEEDHSRGKDRPVLLVGRDGRWLLGLQLTSRDHDRDADQERRAGREWVDIGSGAWDRQGRPSEVRVNRILRVDPAAIRREGAVLAREQFDAVAAAVRAHHG
jgi:hypothetical protein